MLAVFAFFTLLLLSYPAQAQAPQPENTCAEIAEIKPHYAYQTRRLLYVEFMPPAAYLPSIAMEGNAYQQLTRKLQLPETGAAKLLQICESAVTAGNTTCTAFQPYSDAVNKQEKPTFHRALYLCTTQGYGYNI